jgi:hypothetical protein
LFQVAEFLQPNRDFFNHFGRITQLLIFDNERGPITLKKTQEKEAKRTEGRTLWSNNDESLLLF